MRIAHYPGTVADDLSARADLPPSPLTWAYADGWAEEEPALAAARRAAQSLGVPCIARSTGAALRLLTASIGATAVVELGSGTGVSGGWIIGGLAPDGILTTVDSDPELHALSRDTFIALGVPHTQVRAIGGEPFDVLTRLLDGAYDLMVIGPGLTLSVAEEHALLTEAARLLRPGGTIAVTHALADDGADPAHRDLAAHLRDDPHWIAGLLTVGDGLLVAAYRPDPEAAGLAD